MSRVTKWLSVGVITAVASLGVAVPKADAFYPYRYSLYPFGYYSYPYGFYGYNPVGFFNPGFHPHNYYANGFYIDPYAYLNGASNVIAAQGYYLAGASNVIETKGRYLSYQGQAALSQEQARGVGIENRKSAFTQTLREWKDAPSREDVRERLRKDEVRRAQNVPPVAEIFSGKSLNDLLVDLQRLRAQGVQGHAIALNADLVRQINTTNGRNRVHPGVINQDDKLSWPVMLRQQCFQSEREKLDRILTTFVARREISQAETPSLADCLVTLGAMQDRLDTMLKTANGAASWTPTQWCKASGFLRDCENAVKALQDTDARYLTGTYTAKVNTVGELVAHMTENGLRFGPVAAGNESAYLVLHRMMADYSLSAHAEADALAQTKTRPRKELFAAGE